MASSCTSRRVFLLGTDNVQTSWIDFLNNNPSLMFNGLKILVIGEKEANDDNEAKIAKDVSFRLTFSIERLLIFFSFILRDSTKTLWSKSVWRTSKLMKPH